MDDREIKALDDKRLAVLAGMEAGLRKERDEARRAHAQALEEAEPCERCKHKTSPGAKRLRLAWTTLTNAWGAADRALREVVQRIDPEKKRQRDELAALRRRKAELQIERADAVATAAAAKKEHAQAEEDSAGDQTLLVETKGALDDAQGKVKTLDRELAQLTKREGRAEQLLEKAVAEFVSTHRPKAKELESIEQELRAAIFPKPKATAHATAQV